MRFIGIIAVGLAAGQVCMAQAFKEPFLQLDRRKWVVADYDFSHPKFDTDWREKLARVNRGLSLVLRPQKGHANRFAGASVRRRKPTGFGRYEVVIQPARGAGIVTGFFTYTGAGYGTRHDEIDIEFLGKDTRKIHLAVFVDGRMWNRFVDLGFDAAEKPGRYGFEWGPDFVRWYVEDELIWELTADPNEIPQIPGRIFTNIWAADRSISAWAGMTKPGVFGTAKVSHVQFEPMTEAGF